MILKIRKKIKELENENEKSKELNNKIHSDLNNLFDNSSFEKYNFIIKGANDEKIFIRQEVKPDFVYEKHFVFFEKLTESNKMETLLKCEYRLQEKIIFTPHKEIVWLWLDWVSCTSGNESKGYGSLCMNYLFYIVQQQSICSVRGCIGSTHTSDEINRERLLNYYKKFGFNVKMSNEYSGEFYLDFDDKGLPLKISHT